MFGPGFSSEPGLLSDGEQVVSGAQAHHVAYPSSLQPLCLRGVGGAARACSARAEQGLGDRDGRESQIPESLEDGGVGALGLDQPAGPPLFQQSKGLESLKTLEVPCS